ncbi:MAG: hypothetical protein ACREUG_18080, partial [Steroidobacteraceae bacterium]
METIDQIKHALERLSILDRMQVEGWLQMLNESEARSSGIAEALAVYETADPIHMTLAEFLEF